MELSKDAKKNGARMDSLKGKPDVKPCEKSAPK